MWPRFVWFGPLLLLLQLGGTNSITFEEDVTINEKQRAILKEFKDKVSPKLPHDYMHKDIYLIQWLRARNFDLEGAEKMLMANLRWRAMKRMDTIHQQDWTDMYELMPYYLEGRDNYGRSILYLDIGGLDLRKVVTSGKGERLQLYLDKAVDDACNLVRERGERYGNITRGHLIVNLDGYNLIQHACLNCISIILNLVTSYEGHWPHCADKIILINTPAIFQPFLDLLKTAMNPDTKRSLLVFGTNKKKYRDGLSEEFDFSLLPPQIGGTKVYTGMDNLH